MANGNLRLQRGVDPIGVNQAINALGQGSSNAGPSAGPSASSVSPNDLTAFMDILRRVIGANSGGARSRFSNVQGIDSARGLDFANITDPTKPRTALNVAPFGPGLIFPGGSPFPVQQDVADTGAVMDLLVNSLSTNQHLGNPLGNAAGRIFNAGKGLAGRIF